VPYKRPFLATALLLLPLVVMPLHPPFTPSTSTVSRAASTTTSYAKGRESQAGMEMISISRRSHTKINKFLNSILNLNPNRELDFK